MSEYAELHLHTYYSIHEGASSIGELVGAAKKLGYEYLAITDHDNLTGAMEFALACQDMGIKPVIGCEPTLTNGHHLTLLSETQHGYANLCWLISQAYKDDREHPAIDPALFTGKTDGLIALSGCRHGEVPSLVSGGKIEQAKAIASQYRDLFGATSYFIELQQHLVKGDTGRNRELAKLAEAIGVGIVATGNVHYHERERHRLQDCLVSISQNKSLEETHRERRDNCEFYLKSPAGMFQLFRRFPEAIQNTMKIAERCSSFDLVHNPAYKFPDYPVPEGQTSDTHLQKLCLEAAGRRYGSITPKVKARLDLEFRLIQTHGLAGFFLIYHDIIGMAHEVAIDLGISNPEVPMELNPPGRGRGSSVAMLIGYLLGLSHIDPLLYELSLERFLPDDDLSNVPDIDLDFPRNIREELILRVHQRYGWDHAALTGMIDRYRIRGAIRDLGKALGLPHDQVDKLAKRVDDASAGSLKEQMEDLPEFKAKMEAPVWRHLLELASQLDNFPFALAQHPGGMVISSRPLTDIVPVQPSAIDGRYIMQWDKDSIDVAGMVKIDFLALGALSQIQDALRAIEQRHNKTIDLSRIDFEDKAVYRMMHDADTIGIFQIESAAQMQTIPRLKPLNLTDMAFEVGAVRPGVGARDGVKHFINRRSKTEAWDYDHPLEKKALARTLGVILYQDQVNQVAMDVASLTASEADRMRRAFSKRHNEELIKSWWEKFKLGARNNGVSEEAATRIFAKFNGQYMFPEAHAYAFGITAYQATWLKYYYPLEFYLGLFNQQPMGFYSPETLKEDARRHEIGLLNPDMNKSEILCKAEENNIRLGFTYVRAIADKTAQVIVSARGDKPFVSLADLMIRTGLVQQELENLIDAGAVDSLCSDRRKARWEVGLRYQPVGQQMPMSLSTTQDMPELALATSFEKMGREYQTMSMYPSGHVMGSIRKSLGSSYTTSCELPNCQEGDKVKLAGLVIRVQRPAGKALFITLEDEFGHMPLMVWPKTYAKQKQAFKASFLEVEGTVSRREGTLNVLVECARPLNVTAYAPKARYFR
ncbi:MAG: DNA polymerase III subunit alpha [Dehalococcoidia bacterium]|nr:DNA polymerase III subunit alpha [Dehalococcoidia bacterium]